MLTINNATGSAASAIQAGSGGVAAGSAFATAQSAAAGGYGSAVFGFVVRTASAILGGIGLVNASQNTCTDDKEAGKDEGGKKD